MLPINERTLTMDETLMVTDNMETRPTAQNIEQADSFIKQLPKRVMGTSLLLVVSGEIQIRINLNQHIVKAGCCLIVSSGAIIESVDYIPETRVIHILVEQKALPAIAQLHDNHINRLYLMQSVCMRLSPEHLSMLVDGYKLLRRIIEMPDFNSRHEAVYSCLNMLGMIIKQGKPVGLDSSTLRDEPASRKNEIAARFMKCVQENYRQHRDLTFYADQLCLSLKYMSRVVFEQTGRHPSQWIKDYVILEAKTLLRSGRYTVQQVADELNFPNQSFFGKYFKEAVGISPRKWITNP